MGACVQARGAPAALVPSSSAGAHDRCSRSSPPQPAMSEARDDGVHGVAPAYPARRGDAGRSASTRINMPPTMLIKCSTNCQREESGGKSTKCMRVSVTS
jgi:hypothetical protein